MSADGQHDDMNNEQNISINRVDDTMKPSLETVSEMQTMSNPDSAHLIASNNTNTNDAAKVELSKRMLGNINPTLASSKQKSTKGVETDDDYSDYSDDEFVNRIQRVESKYEIMFGNMGVDKNDPEIYKVMTDADYPDFGTSRSDSVVTVSSQTHGVFEYTTSKYVLRPDSKWLFAWNCFILVLVFFTALYVPFTLGISQGGLIELVGNWFLVFTFINIFFIVDVIIIFFTPYRDKSTGYMIFSQKAIVKHYLTGWFIIDLIACIPNDDIFRVYCYNATSNLRHCTLLNLLNLFRIFRFRRISTILRSDALLHYTLRFYGVRTKMAVFVVFVFVYLHWFACTLAFVAVMESGDWEESAITSTYTWVSHYLYDVLNPQSDIIPNFSGYSFKACMTRYIVSLYWTIVCITSIGFGDIVPVTVVELWVVALMLCSGSFLYAVLIAYIISAVNELEEPVRIKSAKLSEINQIVDHFVELNKSSTSLLEKRAAKEFDTPHFAVKVANAVRWFIYSNGDYANFSGNWYSFADMFPVTQHLPLQMQQRLMYILAAKYLSGVSCLLHNSISFSTLAAIASQCQFQVFARGSHLRLSSRTRNSLGVYVVKIGLMMHKTWGPAKFRKFVVSGKGKARFMEYCLVPTHSPLFDEVTLAFLVTTHLIMLPRKVFGALMRIHPGVWRDYGRWYVLRLGLSRWARQMSEQESLSTMTGGHIQHFTSQDVLMHQNSAESIASQFSANL